MIGLLFLASALLWLWACLWISKKVGSLAKEGPIRIATKLIVLLFVLSLPFLDELIGKRQFESRCERNGIASADISTARGKKVRVEYGERKLLSDTVVPMKESVVLFKDANSGEALIEYKNYYASGGWLMRYTWLGMGSEHPMLFRGNGCGFSTQDRLFKATGISIVN